MKPIMPLAAHSSCGDFSFFFCLGCSKKTCRDTEISITKPHLKESRGRVGGKGDTIGMSPHQTTWNNNSLCLLIRCVPLDPHFSKSLNFVWRMGHIKKMFPGSSLFQITQFCITNGSYEKMRGEEEERRLCIRDEENPLPNILKRSFSKFAISLHPPTP
jgi:hypothetical protein